MCEVKENQRDWRSPNWSGAIKLNDTVEGWAGGIPKSEENEKRDAAANAFSRNWVAPMSRVLLQGAREEKVQTKCEREILSTRKEAMPLWTSEYVTSTQLA